MDILIALDDYEDIFDDFDIRPYASRNISIDFFSEVVRRLKKAEDDKIRLVLTMPKYKRIKRVEKKIIKRLHNFFSAKLNEVTRRKAQALAKGIVFICIGLISTFVSYYFQNTNIYLSELAMVAVYFFTWKGLAEIFESIPALSKREWLLRKIAKAKILFVDEEEVEN